MPLLPLSIDGERLQPRQAIASIGQHTREVLESLGYTSQQIDGISPHGSSGGPARAVEAH